jgi:hypothetical protein
MAGNSESWLRDCEAVPDLFRCVLQYPQKSTAANKTASRLALWSALRHLGISDKASFRPCRASPGHASSCISLARATSNDFLSNPSQCLINSRLLRAQCVKCTIVSFLIPRRSKEVLQEAEKSAAIKSNPTIYSIVRCTCWPCSHGNPHSTAEQTSCIEYVLRIFFSYKQKR